MKFSNRILNLLIENNISNSKLSKATGISTARISNFCNDKDMPSLDNAFLLANYFKCSFQYLFALCDEYKKIHIQREYSSTSFLKRLNVLLSVNLITQRKFCQEISINKACFSNWRKGQKPKSRTLIKIAYYFNCTIDYLLATEKE